MSTWREVIIEYGRDGVAALVLNRPDRLNAITERMRSEIIGALHDLDAEPGVRAIVLTGQGDRAFAAGQDLAEAAEFDSTSIARWIDGWGDLYNAVLSLRKPSVAAVNGYAVGAAFQLAVLCDFRVASTNAQFGMPEIGDGIPCITGTWSLYELLGRGRSADLVLSGRLIDAETAASWGLVSSVVAPAQLRARATDLAAELGDKPMLAMQLTKAWLRTRLWDNWQAHAEYAKEAHGRAFESGEPQARMAAFLRRNATH